MRLHAKMSSARSEHFSGMPDLRRSAVIRNLRDPLALPMFSETATSSDALWLRLRSDDSTDPFAAHVNVIALQAVRGSGDA